MEKETGKIYFLDSVRAIATLAVFMFHAGYLLVYPQNKVLNLVRFVTYGGTVGVSMFFVLSGFLLFYQMYKKEEALTRAELWNYAKKRMLRILPLYYFSLFFIILFLRPYILTAPDGLRSILFNLVFLRGIKGANGGGTITIDPVYWTLVIEMHFYFLLPIFYYIFFKFKNIRPFLAVILLGFGYRMALVAFVHNPTMQMLRFTPANFDFFAFGMLGAYLYTHRVKWLESIGKGYIQALLIVVFILFVRFYDLDFNPTFSYVLAPVFLGLIIALGMLSFIANNRTLLSKFLTSAPIPFIAKISFSVYIWHALVIQKVDYLLISNNAKFFLSVIITLIVSTISYYVVEAPFLRLKPKGKPAAPVSP